MDKELKKNKISLILWVIFYFFIFTLLLRGSFGYLDPDFGWHLQVGQEIAASGTVPDINQYNFTFTGHWVDHEWLSNELVFLLYNQWGYIAVAVCFALLIVAVLVILNVWVRRRYPATSDYAIIFFQTFGIAAASPHFGVRMQEFGVLFLTLLLLSIYQYNKDKQPLWLLALPLLMFLWACLHGSFLIGFVIAAAWIAVKILEKLLSRYYHPSWLDFSEILKGREIALFAGAVLLSFGATLLTPYRGRLYSFLAGYKDSFYLSHIQEWLPQSHYPFQYGQLIYLALVAMAIILYFYYSRGPKRLWRINIWTLALAGLFLILSFKSRRHFPLLFVATFSFLTIIFSRLFQIDDQVKSKTGKWVWLKNNWVQYYLALILLLAAFSQLALTEFTSTPFLSFQKNYPVGAVDFLQARPEYNQLRLFNDYGWGGYLIQTMPGRKIFIDGRLPQVEYRGQTFLEEYLDFFNSDKDIAGKLDSHGIDLVMIPVKDKELRAKKWEQIVFGMSGNNLMSPNGLRNYLLDAGDWQVIYFDETAIIYKRIKQYAD